MQRIYTLPQLRCSQVQRFQSPVELEATDERPSYGIYVASSSMVAVCGDTEREDT